MLWPGGVSCRRVAVGGAAAGGDGWLRPGGAGSVLPRTRAARARSLLEATPGPLQLIRRCFRLWRRPRVRRGGRYLVGPAVSRSTPWSQCPLPGSRRPTSAGRGKRDRESLRQRADHAGPIADDTLVFRVEFHIHG